MIFKFDGRYSINYIHNRGSNPCTFPGIKLGLANVISLVTLIMLGGYEALLVMFLRTLLGSMFAGNMSSFMFSLAGGF